MEERSPEDQPAQENLNEESENMECDEMLGASTAVTNTDSIDKAATDEKAGPINNPSDSTSSSDIVSKYTTSASDIPCVRATSDAEERKQSLQSECTSGIEVISRSTTSTSEIPCEGATTSDAEEKQRQSPLQSESSGLEMISRSTTSASEIPCERGETADTEKKKPEASPLPSELTVVEQGSESTSVSEAQSEGVSTGDAVEKTEHPLFVSNVKSTSPKISIFGKAKNFFSPSKSGKSKESRSKSMSPSKKTQSTDSKVSKPVSGESGVSSGEYSKKGTEKGVLRSIYKTWDKLKIGSKSSESASLVPNEKIDKTEEPETSKLDNPSKNIDKTEEPKTSKHDNLPGQLLCETAWWTDVVSLNEKPSLDGTTMTDLPSTCSGADVFSSDSAGKPLEKGENTSEEAVSGSLVSSPDAEISDIQKDKDGECIKKNGSSTDEKTKNVASGDNSKENLSTANDIPSNEEGAQNEVPAEKQTTAKDSTREDKD